MKQWNRYFGDILTLNLLSQAFDAYVELLSSKCRFSIKIIFLKEMNFQKVSDWSSFIHNFFIFSCFGIWIVIHFVEFWNKMAFSRVQWATFGIITNPSALSWAKQNFTCFRKFFATNFKMPKSKRDKRVALSKTQKKVGLETKQVCKTHFKAKNLVTYRIF